MVKTNNAHSAGLEWGVCLFWGRPDWSSWLAEGDAAGELAVLRQNVERGLPRGTEAFVKKLERLTGKPLQFRPRGRPRWMDMDDRKG